MDRPKIREAPNSPSAASRGVVTEAEIQNKILLELGREPDVTLWRQNTGMAKAERVTRAHVERLIGWLSRATQGVWQQPVASALELLRALHAEPQRYTHYGLCKGSSDIIGIVHAASGRGIFLALEVKTPTGTLSNEQRMFLDLVSRRGGVGRRVDSVVQARAAIDEARAL